LSTSPPRLSSSHSPTIFSFSVSTSPHCLLFLLLRISSLPFPSVLSHPL
jgi:hypothetical protein